MKRLGIFKAADVEENPPIFDYDSFKPRKAARAIVFNNKKVALIKVGKHNYYMLPGGGIDKDTIREGLLRELMEELGGQVRITGEVGSTVTYLDRWKNKQNDYCYTAELINLIGSKKPTKFEQEEGHKVVWAKDITKAIKLVEESKPKDRDGKLVQARDLQLLKSC